MGDGRWWRVLPLLFFLLTDTLLHKHHIASQPSTGSILCSH